MKRLSLFEFGDQPWLPEALRSSMTAFLTAAYSVTPLPRLWAEALATVLDRKPEAVIVDLGSGSGGPIGLILAELSESRIAPRVMLTDLRPRLTSDGLPYWPEPVDALNVPAALPGILTMFATFHHFPPAEAREILRNAFSQGRTMCIFGATSRTFRAIASSVLIPLLVLLLTPRIRSVSWPQIAFTYLIPILPFIIFWDGLVSHLRTYQEGELREMIQDRQSPQYQWKVGVSHIGFGGLVPWLVGHPVLARADNFDPWEGGV